MTTTSTISHNSTTCAEAAGQPCEMCAWANDEVQHRIAQSAAAIRARRAALLERATPHSPTEGAVALAEAHLSEEAWFQHLPNNAMQDAAVLELAGRIEEAVGSWLQGRREDDER